MATLFINGLDVPNDKLATLAKAFGVRHAYGETVEEVKGRLEDAIITFIKRRAKASVKRDKFETESVTEVDDILIKN
jgi:predicted RNase H-like HicB family nuclease